MQADEQRKMISSGILFLVIRRRKTKGEDVATPKPQGESAMQP